MHDLTIAVLGTGIMGAPMARNIAQAGSTVRVWNRTRDKAEALADVADVVDRPVEAVLGADVVVTMLADADALEAVVDDDVLAAMGSALWLQMSTVGPRATDRLIARTTDADVALVDAPVLGTREPAEQGALLALASGDDALRDRAAPVLEAVGRKTLWLGPAGTGSRVKLVVNTWVVGIVGALAESIVLAEALDVDPAQFLAAIDGGAVGAPYAQVKGRAMIAGEFPASFPARLALKDARLVAEAGRDAGARLRLVDAVVDAFAATVAEGHGDEDMAAVVHAVRPPGG